MSIRKRGKSYEIDYKDVTGVRIRKSGFKTKAEAQIAYSEALTNRSKGLSNVINKNMTLKDACIYSIEKYAQRQCKRKTIKEYNIIVNSKILPYFKDMKLINLTKENVETFIDTLLDEKLSNATVNKYITVLSSIIERQVENGSIFQNVVKKIRKLKENKKEVRALTKDEINIVLDTCKTLNKDFYPMLYTAFYTGMRRGELIALQWENVDLQKNIISVKYSEYNGNLCSPKSSASIRKINIVDNLRRVLLEQKMKVGGSLFVFPNSQGGMYMGNNVTRRLFNPVMEASGIGKFRFHDIRHTYGSILMEGQTPIKYIQEQMGHASAKVTLDIYTHSSDVSKNIAEKVLNNLLKVS